MKHIYARFGTLLSAVLIVAVVFSLDSCKGSDLEFIDPFEFPIDYEEPEEPVIPQEPTASTPVLPTVTPVPAAAQQQSNALTSAATPAAIPANVQTTLSNAGSVSSSSGLNSTTVQNFDKGDLNAIGSTPVANLDQNVVAAAQAAAQNPVLKALFPSLTIPGGRIASGSVNSIGSTENSPNPIIPGTIAATLETLLPCQIKLQEDFDNAIADLDAWKQPRVNAVTSDFNAGIAAVNTAYTQGVANALAQKNATIESAKAFVSSALDNADRFASIDAALATAIRQFAILYYYYALIISDLYYTTAVQAYTLVKTTDTNAWNNWKEVGLDQINTAYNSKKAEYTATFEDAYAKCHNQGD